MSDNSQVIPLQIGGFYTTMLRSQVFAKHVVHRFIVKSKRECTAYINVAYFHIIYAGTLRTEAELGGTLTGDGNDCSETLGDPDTQDFSCVTSGKFLPNCLDLRMSLTTLSNSFSLYSFFASVTVLLYDHLLLLPTEINYVWLPRPVHPLLLLFALNRYLPLVVTGMSINWLLHEPSLLGALEVFMSQMILMIRTYAIWDRNRVVFWCFIGIGIFSFIPRVVSLGIRFKTSQFVRPFGHADCLDHSSNMENLFYISVLVPETIIASLTFFKGVLHLRRSSHPFIKELYVSGMFFYACLLLITLANILVPMWAPGMTLFLGSLQINLHSILSNQIMLIILKQRQTYRRYSTDERYTSDIELSDITSDDLGS
ncbi:hypothetical protein EDD18DRAFT_1334881 [Armillaria luteobubalina]|uniref:DUF6533 domain-containing protein n=1 Tax=Armillaria luteobubalina TaxID=153913 RepID=A0AA39PSZ6_9AGAR|nr:hypothetical protein EDD18DRAFT_1334881 [Armillaria luteobubalina]